MYLATVEPAIQKVSPEEYLEHEFHAKDKHEFIKGQIKPMAYTSDNHGLTAQNAASEVRAAVKGKDIRVYGGDRLVYSPICEEFYYPDIIVVKGQPQFFNYKGKMKATLNPIALFEVLSESTEDIDPNDKWPCYREIKSLRQFFLVSQEEPSIEYYTRIEDTNRWVYAYVNGLDGMLPVLDFEIPLREIYALVDWN